GPASRSGAPRPALRAGDRRRCAGRDDPLGRAAELDRAAGDPEPQAIALPRASGRGLAIHAAFFLPFALVTLRIEVDTERGSRSVQRPHSTVWKNSSSARLKAA